MGDAHGSRPLWTPGPKRVADSAMTALRRDASRVAGRELADYGALHAWSVEAPDAFWSMLAEAWIDWRTPPVRTRSDHPLPFARWFEGGRCNVVDRLLWPPHVAEDDLAVVAVAEDVSPVHWSFGRLRREAAAVQRALRSLGLGPGDAVAAYADNVPEVVATFLACAADGIRFTSGSPDFGVDAAVARFEQVRPAVVLASLRSRYAGRDHDRREAAAELARRLGTVRTAVALPAAGGAAVDPPSGFTTYRRWTDLGEATAHGPETRALPFDQEAYVLYSSGTTGAPKAIRHRAGGALLNQWKELRYHLDVRPGDRVLVTTTIGWMMWNWQVAALGAGAAIVLVDGSPVHPAQNRLWRVAEEERVTLFATSAGYLHRMAGGRFRPRELKLGALRTVTSTGSPLSPDGFRWVYDAVKSDLHLASISGGTDIVGCFLIGVPTEPVHAGELQRPALGVDLAVLDEDGTPLVLGAGELVCRSPLPSMPLGFVGDGDGRRYRETYAERFPGAWTHGDRIERTASGGFVHHGRSDATLNPGGVRIGSAEVTGPLLAEADVVDAAAVPWRSGTEEAIVLLVVLHDGVALDDPLAERLRTRIRTAASPRHVPARIVAVPDLPRTRSGKTMERALAALVRGEPTGSLAGAANPEALDAVRRVLLETSPPPT
ncbi:MAG: acetoacetate--CoA ligase [Trueperaceae bacterium]